MSLRLSVLEERLLSGRQSFEARLTSMLKVHLAGEFLCRSFLNPLWNANGAKPLAKGEKKDTSWCIESMARLMAIIATSKELKRFILWAKLGVREWVW